VRGFSVSVSHPARVPSRWVGQRLWRVNYPLKQSVPTHRPGSVRSASLLVILSPLVKKDPHHQQIHFSFPPGISIPTGQSPLCHPRPVCWERARGEGHDFKRLPACRGSFPPLVKTGPHHRRESIFRSRRESIPHRTDPGRPRLRARDTRLRSRQNGRQSAARSAGVHCESPSPRSTTPISSLPQKAAAAEPEFLWPCKQL
jgi:hypothetical protein